MKKDGGFRFISLLIRILFLLADVIQTQESKSMSSLSSSTMDSNGSVSKPNVQFIRLPIKPGASLSANLAYFNYEEDITRAIETIFQHQSFDLMPPKLIILLEGGLNKCSERPSDFDDKQFAAIVPRLLIDIGRNRLSKDHGAAWLFSNLRDDSVAGRILQTTRHQYMANDISLSNFVSLGIDVCPTDMPIENQKDYQSLIDIISYKGERKEVGEPCSRCFTNHSHNRVLNKGLTHNILYGYKPDEPLERHALLQKCLEEIGRVRDSDKSECVSIPKVIILYGGDGENIELIYRLLSAPVDRRKFGLVIIRGSGGLADVLAWACDKIREEGDCFQESDLTLLADSFMRELRVLAKQLLNRNIMNELIVLISYLVKVRCRKIRVCDENDDLSLYLLEALVTANQSQRLSSLKLHLSLAFDLNQPKFASRMLRANQDMTEQDLIQLAKMAIISDQVEFLRVLEDTCGITAENFDDKIAFELSTAMSYNHHLFLECIQQDFNCTLEDICVPLDEKGKYVEDRLQTNHVKLFLWAVFFDHYSLSLHFWRRLNDRLCAAIVAALVYRRTADLCVKRSSTEAITVQNLRDHADGYENLAASLLQSIYVTNPTIARSALKRENYEFNRLTSLDVAIMSESENFISHSSVQEVFDCVWNGEKPHKIKGKAFDRVLTSASSSFGQASSSMQAKDQKDIFKCLLNIKQKLSRPRVKYQVYLLSYLIFLGLLSYHAIFFKPLALGMPNALFYIVISKNCSQNETEDGTCSSRYTFEQKFSLLQSVVNLWILMFALEEIRQVRLFRTRQNSLFDSLMSYLDDSWNRLDCLCIFMYAVSIVFESFKTENSLNAARAFLAIDVVLWFARLLILLMTHRTVGPMLLMVQEMLRDMVTFFSIFLVFTSAYGVASFALLKDGRSALDLTIFRKLFHAAYWHVFGQIDDLDDIKDNFQLTGWTAFILLVFYMAISNILLVNLLVAMFSNTFDRMYSRMDKLWKFHRYHIIKEYAILPPLPPPLNIFSSGNDSFKPFHRELPIEQVLNLRRREALAYESNIFEQATRDRQSESNRQEKFELQIRQLRKTIAHVKLTCQVSQNNT